jgi:hypothetical protein
MPRRKPAGWPKLMVSKHLKDGLTAYYYDPPTWAKKKGCPVKAEALGTDYAHAKKRCDEVLNPQFDAWRTGNGPIATSAATGTFDWMVSVYKGNPKYKDKPADTKEH